MKKFLSFILSAVLSLGTFCACDNGEDVAMEDLEYGATMRRLGDTEVDICFDGRFFTDEEMRAVNDYFYSVQTKNTDLFLSVQSPDYVGYVEDKMGLTAENYLTQIYDDTAASLGSDYEYTYVEAVACGDRTTDSSIDEITKLMDSVYEENDKGTTFKKTITEAKYAVFDITADSNGESYTLYDQVVYIFNCTDGIYIFVS